MSLTETSLPELRDLLIFFSKKLKWQFKNLNYLEFRRKWFLGSPVFARVLRKYPYCLFRFCGFAVTSYTWLTLEYVWVFNACSTRNVEPAGRVYFPLPDLSRKIERDSARRVRLANWGTQIRNDLVELFKAKSNERFISEEEILGCGELFPWSGNYIQIHTEFRY